MKKFNPKTDTIESEIALALILQHQQKAVKLNIRYISLDVHKDTIAVSIASSDGSKPRYYGEVPQKLLTGS